MVVGFLGLPSGFELLESNMHQDAPPIGEIGVLRL